MFARGHRSQQQRRPKSSEGSAAGAVRLRAASSRTPRDKAAASAGRPAHTICGFAPRIGMVASLASGTATQRASNRRFTDIDAGVSAPA
jgi:hypothetical protein